MASIRKRTRKDGTTSYRVDIRLKGHPPERATFKRLTDAKRWGQQTEAAIREGRYFKTRESQKHTLADLIDIYIADQLPGKKTGEKTAAQLKWWRGELGQYLLSDITPGRITECKKKLLSGITRTGTNRTPATTNRYLAALSVCLSYAVKDMSWLDNSPMRKVSKLKEPRGRIRFLSEDEIIDSKLVEGELTRLLKACKRSDNIFLYIVVVVALSTGARRGEITGLQWKDVDLQQGRITLYDTKNGEIRVVPVTGHALELLREHVRAIDTPMLFPGKVRRNQPQDLRAPWLTALKAAEIENFRFHDLRHTAASYLAMNGASLAEIAETLGHKTLQMVKRYSHLSEAHNAGVISKLDQRIFGGES